MGKHEVGMCQRAATHVLKHGADGEAWRQSGGKVFERVDDQVDPVEDKWETQSCRSTIRSAAGVAERSDICCQKNQRVLLSQVLRMRTRTDYCLQLTVENAKPVPNGCFTRVDATV